LDLIPRQVAPLYAVHLMNMKLTDVFYEKMLLKLALAVCQSCAN